jgi:hypothetical protein
MASSLGVRPDALTAAHPGRGAGRGGGVTQVTAIPKVKDWTEGTKANKPSLSHALGVEMALSADEIRVLNEIARGTAGEDPAYTRRMMSYGRSRHGGSRRRGRKARPEAYSEAYPEAPYVPRSPRALVPALLMGIFIIAFVMAMFGVVVHSTDYTHARSAVATFSQVR